LGIRPVARIVFYALSGGNSIVIGACGRIGGRVKAGRLARHAYMLRTLHGEYDVLVGHCMRGTGVGTNTRGART
jgi:hypothetical protein